MCALGDEINVQTSARLRRLVLNVLNGTHNQRRRRRLCSMFRLNPDYLHVCTYIKLDFELSPVRLNSFSC